MSEENRNKYLIDRDDESFSKLDFQSLPDNFDVDTAIAILKIVCGCSQSWENFYDNEGMLEAAEHAIENKGDCSELYKMSGAANGANIIRNSLVDDWIEFIKNRISE